MKSPLPTNTTKIDWIKSRERIIKAVEEDGRKEYELVSVWVKFQQGLYKIVSNIEMERALRVLNKK